MMGNVILFSPKSSSASMADGSVLKATATKGFLALSIVSASAHAVRNCVLNPIPPVETDDPNLQKVMAQVTQGVADLTSKLDTAKSDADIWIKTLGPQIASSIPHHILDFVATFDGAATQILGLLDQAKGTNPPPGILQEAVDLVQALLAQVNGYTTEIASFKQNLDDYAAKVQSDHDALLGGNDAIQSLISTEDTDESALSSAITNLKSEIDAWNKQIMDAEMGVGVSIFVGVIACALAPVSGGASFSLGIVAVGGLATSAAMWGTLQAKVNHAQGEIAADQGTMAELDVQVHSLIALHSTVAGVLTNITNAQTALSDVAIFWQNFSQTLGSVISDLSEPSASLPAVIDEMWVNAAKNNWADLASFAHTLLDTPTVIQTSPAAAA